MFKATIHPVGKPRKIELEMKGDILRWYMRSWAKSYSILIPAECITLLYRTRRDGARIITALLPPLAVLLGFSALVLLDYLMFHTGVAGAGWSLKLSFILYASAAFAASLFLTAFGLIRFLRPRPTVCLQVEDETMQMEFEFWRRPGKDRNLDILLERLSELVARKPEEQPAFPLRSGFMRLCLRPFRAAIQHAMAASLTLFIMTLVVSWLFALAGHPVTEVSPWFLIIFTLPWLWQFGRIGIPNLFMRFQPRLFRQALRHYNYERFDHARHCFQETLKHHPAHVPSLYFLAEIYGARFDFDNAFRYCRLLARSEPEMAESLQSDLWLLKRLGARMQSKS
jgi:tetratricopeptide (TPR) repeat protein